MKREPGSCFRFSSQRAESPTRILSPFETLGIKPTLEELGKDWAALDAARKAYLEK